MMNGFGIEITILLAVVIPALLYYAHLKCKRKKLAISSAKRNKATEAGNGFHTLDIILLVLAFVSFASAVYLICSVL